MIVGTIVRRPRPAEPISDADDARASWCPVSAAGDLRP